jgi:hypothetical protein
MTDPSPVYLGQFPAMEAGDILDLYLDIDADLVSGETISSVAFTVTSAAGVAVVGAVGAHTETTSRTDFRLTAPAAGGYLGTAAFTISDGQKITRHFGLWVV